MIARSIVAGLGPCGTDESGGNGRCVSQAQKRVEAVAGVLVFQG